MTSIVPTVRKVPLKDANDDNIDLLYWLSQSPQSRITAVTLLSVGTDLTLRMDKTRVVKRFLKG